MPCETCAQAHCGTHVAILASRVSSTITRTGNSHARRVLIEAARNHRFQARMSETLQRRQEGQPKAVREIAWRAQRPGYVGIRVMIPDSRAQGVCRPRVTA